MKDYLLDANKDVFSHVFAAIISCFDYHFCTPVSLIMGNWMFASLEILQ